jgi:ATPase subunit of ABC transporter with duplicated ATPase domains
MIYTENLSLSFGGDLLFEDVNTKFLTGNCYGLIGANGAGKSTFLKILSGDIDPSKGTVTIDKNKRLAILKQDQFAYDDHKVVDTVMMGHKTLYNIYVERNALYAKPEMTDADGIRAGEIVVEFAEMGG